jgi:hypothetical protein
MADEKRARREERLRREREEREAEARRRRRNGLIVAAAMVAATVGIVAFALSAGGSDGVDPAKVEALEKAAKAAGCSARDFPEEGHDHTGDPVTYKTNPPTSGNHDPAPAPDGEYESAATQEHLVHTLEHGRIELQYKPGAPAAARAGLKSVFDEDSEHMLLYPSNTGMPYAVAATAWTHMLSCPSYNERVPAAMRAFRDAYRDKGPEKVP